MSIRNHRPFLTSQKDEGIRRKAKEQREATRKYVKALAAVGMKGPAKILAQRIYRNVYFADSLDEALDWLVQQA